ncbi:MAG: hypothetical protein KVP17_001557 [Porospora cf. gigantea B]|uniref:uncharacterized protein n=1 Tax=Porospora cf. gigantea B TaxID=2853592 RepID=UPI003571D364|nr:MAG: hypothetical protein KVP17_001557 [Porospora cf. gigantea B]
MTVPVVSVHTDVEPRWRQTPQLEFHDESDHEDSDRTVPLSYGADQLPLIAERLRIHLDPNERSRQFQALATASPAILDSEKRRVKTALRHFDLDFEKKFGRQPMRAEKESLRPLYTYYRDLKSLIPLAEARKKADSSVKFEEYASGRYSFGAFSAVSSSFSKPAERIYHWRQQGSGSREALTPIRNDFSRVEARLTSLTQEKQKIRCQLQKYQEVFLRQNRREIKYHRDIAPIEAEYRRYKQTKAEIIQLKEAEAKKLSGV